MAEVLLNVCVPVVDRCALRVLLDVAIADLLGVKADVGIRDSSAKGSCGVRSNNLEGRGSGGVECKLIGQGENVEHAESGVQGRLTIAKGVPCNAKARLEIFRGGIGRDGAVSTDRTAGCEARGTIRERGDLLESARGDGVSVDGITGDGMVILRSSGCFVAEAEVQGEAFRDVPVVLEVGGEEALAELDLSGAAGGKRVELVGSVREELSQRAVVVEPSIGTELFEDVVVHPLECGTFE